MKRDEALQPPAEPVGEQHSGERERGDEDDDRAPERFLGDLQIREHRSQRRDHEQVEPEQHEDDGTIDHLPRNADLGAAQLVAGDRHGEQQGAQEEGGARRLQVDRQDGLEQQRLAQDVEPDEEDPAEAEHEILDATPIGPTRRSQTHLEPGQDAHGEKKLNDGRRARRREQRRAGRRPRCAVDRECRPEGDGGGGCHRQSDAETEPQPP